MTYEPVLTVWDYFDGPREGLAHFQGKPCRYENKFDQDLGDFPDAFNLFPVEDEYVDLAMEQWAIWRKWEMDFHSGLVSNDTHPGHGGMNSRYDEIEIILDSMSSKLEPLADKYIPDFQPVDDGLATPVGYMKNLKVCWKILEK